MINEFAGKLVMEIDGKRIEIYKDDLDKATYGTRSIDTERR